MKYPQLVSMPSAVSDWLEEQLEARGIDAVVYTRYVLSLLRRDPVDVISSDQDPQFTSSNKEVKRSGGNRKRSRHSAEWWKRDQAVADKLKRSAAVECLMSASDQKCGIESLVDELCEKLKEINHTNASSQETSCKNDSQFYQTSPQDSAKRYYAAFPPLSRNSATGSPDHIITLIPKWLGSPKKKSNRKLNRSSGGYEDKLHCKVDIESMKVRNMGKQRLAYLGRNKRELGYCRSMTKSMEHPDNMNDWNLYMLTNNSKNKLVSSSWPQTVSTIINNHLSSSGEQCLDINQDSWENNDDDINMYDDLPVDISELLDSPVQQDDAVEMMNLANMRDAGNKTFISCGTNITSSIWSNDANMVDVTYDNNYNSAMDASQNKMLDVKFTSVSVKDKLPGWSNSDTNIIAENETNFFFETLNSNYSFAAKDQDTFADIPWHIPVNFTKIEKWSEDESCDNEMQVNVIAKSFMKLNHSREESSFTEVFPRTAKTAYSIFNNSNVLHLTVMRDNGLRKIDSEKDKVDLLTSSHSHFRPITDKIEKTGNSNYIDGTTFIIPSSLETLPYKRSESGTMYLECEYGIKKKYSEYKMSENCLRSPETKFVLKFNICENDKACQTDSVSLFENYCQVEDNTMKKGEVEQEDFYFPGDQHQLVDDAEKNKCSCIQGRQNVTPIDCTSFNNLGSCQVHYISPDNMANEVAWKSDSIYCENCNSNRMTWNSDWLRKTQVGSLWNRQPSKNIWNGGEVCFTCLGLTDGRPPPSSQQNQLREDVSQDGEQLLSDLSSLQKSYMEQLPVNEISCNISEIIGPKDRKRRHSFISGPFDEILPVHRGSWSFASHLEEDCIIQMSTIPTLRSVTL